MKRPTPQEFAPYYQNYINYVPAGDIIKLMTAVHLKTQQLIQSIPESKGDYRYAPKKWTIKELLVHVIDAERVFAYRALRFARKDVTRLAGFDENKYVPNSAATSRTLTDIAEEFQALRQATITQFKHYSEEVGNRMGTGSNSPFSVQSLAYIIVGHELHHCRILKERYLE